MKIDWIKTGTLMTCGTCNGTGRAPYYGWICGYCNGTGQYFHMPNSATTNLRTDQAR